MSLRHLWNNTKQHSHLPKTSMEQYQTSSPFSRGHIQWNNTRQHPHFPATTTEQYERNAINQVPTQNDLFPSVLRSKKVWTSFYCKRNYAYLWNESTPVQQYQTSLFDSSDLALQNPSTFSITSIHLLETLISRFQKDIHVLQKYSK